MTDDHINPTWQEVIEFLDRSRRPHMAEFVRFASGESKRFGQQRLTYELRIKGLLERLHKYEPPAPFATQPDFRPPPESSD